jgi:hypothetical protein
MFYMSNYSGSFPLTHLETETSVVSKIPLFRELKGMDNILNSMQDLIFSAMIIKNSIFWDVVPFCLPKVNRRFGGKYSLHFQVGGISQATSQCESR